MPIIDHVNVAGTTYDIVPPSNASITVSGLTVNGTANLSVISYEGWTGRFNTIQLNGSDDEPEYRDLIISADATADTKIKFEEQGNRQYSFPDKPAGSYNIAVLEADGKLDPSVIP